MGECIRSGVRRLLHLGNRLRDVVGRCNGVLVLPPADPNSWYIKDGKLYFLLFYGLWDWLETEPGGLDQSLAIASGRWRQCFGDIFETNFMFDGVISDLYQGTCEMRDGSAPLQKGDDDSALPY